MIENNLFDRLDRHGLVMAIWSPTVFLAAALLHKGLTAGGGAWWIGAGFAVLILGLAQTVLSYRGESLVPGFGGNRPVLAQQEGVRNGAAAVTGE